LSKKVQKSQRNSWMKKLEDKRMTTTLKKNKKLLFELFTWNANEIWVLYIQDKIRQNDIKNLNLSCKKIQ
jgi:predicted phosphoadenosine phosphosulfate sulfurtransferase